MSKLVIVESPTKARTIRTFLPDGYRVEASMGHVRDLPSSASEVPAKIKKEPWARLGVNVDEGFEPLYVVPKDKKKTVEALRKLAAEAEELVLATDEDREGESIGWHLRELLAPKGKVRRMVFHEITKEAIQAALTNTRELDTNLVKAQEARRILDRLVGYTVSPLLWKKIAPRLSAGRVQSVAVRLLVSRERERQAFVSGSYWDIKAKLAQSIDAAVPFDAQLHSLGGKRLATGRDFDENTGKIKAGRDLKLLDEDAAKQLCEALTKQPWQVSEIDEKSATRKPYPPFTTATLQMEANRKMGLSARDTMRLAQRLYENGHITYMRTDSVNLSDEAINAARGRIKESYGEEYLHPTPRRYKTKAKGAQEAHEAIRPAGQGMLPADKLGLDGRERKLYDLIWKRAIATQMASARLRFQSVTITVGDAKFRANGRRVEFPGFFRAYVEGSDDPEAALEHQEAPLPALSKGETLTCNKLLPSGHETKPPARYTEATLVKALEAEGIGRPSTYATIIGTIIERRYVFKQRKELVPTFTAFAVTSLLELHFPDLVNVHFTAGMEQRLDDIAAGQAGWLEYLSQFYLNDGGLAAQVKEKEESVDPRALSAAQLTNPDVQVRIGQFGPFLLWEHEGERMTASLPPDIPPADLTPDAVRKLMALKTEGPSVLTTDPETKSPVYVKVGPYGPYVQLGDNGDNGKKPKRTSLLKGMKPEDVTAEIALKLLDLPRTIGKNPDNNKVVRLGVGRFGPYVLHDKKYTSIKEPMAVLDMTLEQALEVIKNAPAKGGRGAKETLKELGEHPEDGKPINVYAGRYGPYVNHGRINATLPKDTIPEDVTLEKALELIEARKAKKKKKGRARKK